MQDWIELIEEIGEYCEDMEVWTARVHYGGHVTEGFALLCQETCDWFESDPRDLDYLDGLRLSCYMPGERPGNKNEY